MLLIRIPSGVQENRYTSIGMIDVYANMKWKSAEDSKQKDSDIDVMLLLNVGQDQLAEERKKVFDIADEIDLKYDVVLTPILQSMDIYNKFLGVSMFFQNIEKEGVRYA